MSLWSSLLALLGSGAGARIAQDAAPPRQPDAPRERFNPAAGGIDVEALRAMLGAKGARPDFNPFAPAKPPPWVPKSAGMAMDDAGAFGQITDWAGQNLSSILFDREGFLGYPELAHLAQRPEYRSPVEIISEDATAQWIEIQSAGEDEGKSGKIREIEDRFTDLGVKRAVKQASEHDGFFGRGHIYIDLGEEGDELKTPIRDASGKIAKAKIGRGKLKGIVNSEPVWIWPQNYNTTNPLKKDFYVPKSWVCMTQEVDASRMLTFIARPVPDLLKAAYMFGGLSATQMMKPTVMNWLRTRKGIGDLVLAYATMVLSTNMVDVLNLGGADPQVPGGSPAGVFRRAELFNLLRDNLGLFLMDKESEDFKNVSTPLGGLDALQSQAQEHQASPLRIPGIKMFGIQPAGMNASSVGEISIYKGTICAYQEHLCRSPIQTLLEIVQYDMFGEVDPDISFRFRELTELTALEKADLEFKRAQTATIHIDNNSISPLEERRRIAEDPDTPYDSLDVDKPVPLSPESRKVMADTDQVLIDEGVISAEEARERVASDPDGGYGDLKGTPPPDLFKEEEAGLEPQGGRPQLQQTELQQGMPQGEEEGGPAEGGGPKASASPRAHDAAWEESKHKRGQPKNAGQFGSGGSGAGSGVKGGARTETHETPLPPRQKPARLTPTEKAHISDYSGDKFLELNKKLREGGDGGPQAKSIDSAIAKNVLPAGTKLYRRIDKDSLKKMIGGDTVSLGQTFSDKAFASTTQDLGSAAALGFGGVMLHIDVGEDQNGLDMGALSNNPAEKETLLPRNTKMKVIGIKAPKSVGDPVVVRVQTVKDNA